MFVGTRELPGEIFREYSNRVEHEITKPRFFQMRATRSKREPIVRVNDRAVFTVDNGTAVARIVYPISGTVQMSRLLWVHYSSLHGNSPGAERSTFEISGPGGNSRSTFLINGARVFLFSIRSR